MGPESKVLSANPGPWSYLSLYPASFDEETIKNNGRLQRGAASSQ